MIQFRNLRLSLLDDADAFADHIDLKPETIRRHCRAFPSRTAIGLDEVAFKDIELLPDEALIMLAGIMRYALRNLALPVQILINLMVMLGKPAGGSRTIAILATFYRLLMRILSPMVTEWDTKAAGHWDSAIRGSSSLRAQLARSLELELAHAEGLFP